MYIFLQTFGFRVSSLFISLSILGIFLSAQFSFVSGQSHGCGVGILPLAYHRFDTSVNWTNNIKNVLKNLLTSYVSLSRKRNRICSEGLRHCQKGFQSSCCRNLSPNSDDVQNLFDNHYFCPDLYSNARNATRCITGTLSAGSVSPWVISVNYNRLRYPSEIWEAKCACSGSCSNLRVGNMDYHHQPIMSKMLVGIKDDQEGQERFEVQEFAVGCTCAVH